MATRRFDIEPCRGALPVRFDMVPDEVHALIGAPSKQWRDADGWLREMYDLVQVFYDQSSKVQEVSFVPGSAIVTIAGFAIFNPDPDFEVFRKLLSASIEVRELVGFLIFYDFCVTTTGFHDNDPDQLSVVAFRPDVWSDKRAEAKVFKVS